MKKMRLIMSALILCLVFTAPLQAFGLEQSGGSAASISLESDKSQVTAGDIVTVKVIVRNADDLYGLQFRMKYDTDKLFYSGVTIHNEYSDYSGTKVGIPWGTVVVPLLRKDASDKAAHSELKIAELQFTTRSAGSIRFEIEQHKAVTSEKIAEGNGHEDLREIAMTSSGPLSIAISAPPSIPSAPTDVQKGLQELENKINANSPEQALAQLSMLLASGTGKFTQAELNQLEALTGKLQQLLQNSVSTASDSAAQALKLDEASLTKALQSLNTLTSLAENNSLKLPYGKEIHIQLSGKSASQLLVTPEQAKLLNQNGFKLVLEDQQGSIAVSSAALSSSKQTMLELTAAADQKEQTPNKHLEFVSGLSVALYTFENGEKTAIERMEGQVVLTLNYAAESPNAHKLGVYAWNPATSSWDYVQKAKQLNGQFKLTLLESGIYAVMAYSAHFNDIDKVYQEARHAIEALAAKHVMNGTGNDLFSPGKEITRAEFVALLVRIVGLDPVADDADSFKDVNAAAWYAGEVNAAKKAGIVQGDGVNFNPGGKLTREEMAVMMVNAGLLERMAPSSNRFADDASISEWAKDAVYLAREYGLIKGVGDNTLKPKAKANRADVAVILLRLINQQ